MSYRCHFCGRTARLKDDMIEHLNRYHARELADEGLDAAQSLYKSTHGTIHGRCMVCGGETDWNEKTGKPHKLCDNPKCRETVRKNAVTNHVRIHGKETLLDDMEHQREMQTKRHTAGTYRFIDGGSVDYLSGPEKNFLQFCSLVLELRSNMITRSPEFFEYYDPKSDRIRKYDPDYYLPDYNLLVEIKDGGDKTNTNPAFVKDTKYKNYLKDEVMRRQTKYNFIKITGQNYGPFVELLYHITHEEPYEDSAARSKNFVVIQEHAADPDASVDLTGFDEEGGCYLITAYDPSTNMPAFVGLSEDSKLSRIYIDSLREEMLHEVSHDDPCFDGLEVHSFVPVGVLSEARMDALRSIRAAIDNPQVFGHRPSILSILAECGINFTDPHGSYRNNTERRMDFISAMSYLPDLSKMKEG